jgi:hypothetical protein
MFQKNIQGQIKPVGAAEGRDFRGLSQPSAAPTSEAVTSDLNDPAFRRFDITRLHTGQFVVEL